MWKGGFFGGEVGWLGYNFAGCCSDSGGMRMSSKKPIVTVKEKEDGGLNSVMGEADRSQTRPKKKISFPARDLMNTFQQLFFLVCWTKDERYEHINLGENCWSCTFSWWMLIYFRNSVLEILKNWKLTKRAEVKSKLVMALTREDNRYRELPPGCSTWSCRWGSHRGTGERRHT